MKPSTPLTTMTKKKYTGATLLTALLERQEIRQMPGIPGGAILPFYDALHTSPIRHILARHEQGAGFIAQGMARVTGRAATCVATSGPGATNLITAIADARLDSIPLVAITGQVAQSLIGTDAFQEVDFYGLTVPITKHNYLVRNVRELLHIVPEAFTLAESGRPGPVVIDVPKDVQTASIELSDDELPAPGGCRPTPPAKDAEIDALARMLAKAQRPVLYLGGGIIAANASEPAHELAKRLASPVVSTLNALGAIPAASPHHMGMLGMHGTRATHTLLDECDLLIAIGARFDDRATGKVAEFCPRAAIAHIDIDRAEFGKIKRPHLSIEADAADVLHRLLNHSVFHSSPAIINNSKWLARATALRDAHPLRHPSRETAPLHPVNICRFLAKTLPGDAIIATDVGQHQMWVAQAYPFRSPRTLLTSGGLGTMGFGLPTAIGAAFAAPGKRIACVSGDGSLLMNIQELATLADHNLPVAVLVFNNAHLGLVRQQQELFYGRRYEASRFETTPDFAALARAFGIRGHSIAANSADPLGDIAAALAQPGPCLVDIPVIATENVLPMVPPGAANNQSIEHAGAM
ncbi:acetolactate synthase-1/2/3 large subunit [Ereboglobus sp. PH5-5]|uniref:biosynthetic-type acetolactate synthase large subunit n=1 Tax=unclassified Ereboglobus TaxID=2626932 RepID=UPI002404CCEB|nr:MULTISPECIES: biosynthetic-type acetolactate synthase large subunit [unclassified Ereboglobus]MDF9827089.1 acetolactate synthase-1/2/3 large subunit [Ereboglobus sp. PH5-10]MDF9832505.1 acetolactate synthase-1/2/3 large subunit [Ereboglobus sp. PH5-5]